MLGAWIAATATITTTTPVPAPLISTSTKSSGGNASMTSTVRISSGSISERLNPAISPIVRPSRYASSVAAIANPITERPPHRMRLSTSRPRKSVPSQAEPAGPVSGVPIGASGSCGAREGPSSATRTTTATISAPTAPAPVRRNRSRRAHAGSRIFGTSSITIRSASRFSAM